MGFKTELDPNSTPKLTLSKLSFRDEPARHMQTPPLRPSVSIPFHWEEAPGKPRAMLEMGTSSNSKCLELPPRLKLREEEAKFRMMSVLEGPYVGRSLSLACTFSFRKGVGREEGVKSGRWGSEMKCSSRESSGRGYSQSLGDIFRSADHNDNVNKMRRVRRRGRSFFTLSTLNCNSKYLWGDIYASFKQAVPWTRAAHEKRFKGI